MYETIVLSLLLLSVFGVPTKWSKCEGGLTYNWVGYYQDLQRFKLGISVTRASWLAKWLDGKLEADRVRAKELTEVLGRFGFAAIALDFIKPFLGPIYAWTSAAPEYANLKLPVMLRLIFLFLRRVFRDPALFTITAHEYEDDRSEIAFLGDAHASPSSVGVGGHQAGMPSQEAHWFATELTPSNAPWAFGFGDETFRATASLELYTTLLCVKLLPLPKIRGRATLQLSVGTDNQGNMFALKRWSTTKYPLCLILMELAVECRRREISLDLHWIPRHQNCLSDQLSNGQTHNFSAVRRIEVVHDSLHFHVLPEMMETAASLYLSIEDRKKLGKTYKAAGLTPVVGKNPKRLKTDRLKAIQPWGT